MTTEDALKDRYHAPSAIQFYDEDEQTIDFLEADDLRHLAYAMIEGYPEFSHLKSFPLVYLWKKDGGKTGGKATLGKCTKASGLVKYFSEATWVIWLAANHVNEMMMTKRQVEALIYHELSHASVEVSDKGDVKPVVVAHDFVGFIGEVERYGDWMADLKECKKAWEQMALPVGE